MNRLTNSMLIALASVSAIGMLSVPTMAKTVDLADETVPAEPSEEPVIPSMTDATGDASAAEQTADSEITSPDMSAEVPAAPSIEPETAPLGIKPMYEAGTYSISIPAIGYSMALNSVGDPQAVVDNPSEAYFGLEDMLNHKTIADHARQGLSGLKNMPVGTTGTLVLDGKPITITEVATVTGYNTGQGLFTDSGESVWDMYPNTYIIYTCLDTTGYAVVLTFWSAS